jgi:hypothetical protein
MGRNLHSDRMRSGCKGPEVRGSLLPKGSSCGGNCITPLSWRQSAVELIKRNFTRVCPFYINLMGMSIRWVYKVRQLMSPESRGMCAPSYNVPSYTGESIGVKPEATLLYSHQSKSTWNSKGTHFFPVFILCPISSFTLSLLYIYIVLSFLLKLRINLDRSYDSLERDSTRVSAWQLLPRERHNMHIDSTHA